MSHDLTPLDFSVLVVDLLILKAIAWALYENSIKIYRSLPTTTDIPFRCLMFLLCLNYITANGVALDRHIDIVFFGSGFALDTVKSLLWDRGFMMSTSILICLLSWKYKPIWYI